MSEPPSRPAARTGPTISVVIPTWLEAPLVADAVACARRIGDEVIVADGGSPDGTGERARAAGARVVMSAKGRGLQLRAGAEAARGEVLVFLHADARLPASARRAIEGALADPRVVGGAFFLRFLPSSWFTRLLEPANDLRRRVTRRTYGDTAIFVRAEVLHRVGGIRPWPVMHDYELSGRLRRAGRWAYLREPSVWASARRFEGRELRTLARWLLIQGLYRLGASPHFLGRFYPDARGGRPEAFIASAAARTGAAEDEARRPPEAR